MNTLIKKQIQQEALTDTSVECCGFIYTKDSDVKIFPCKNISLEPHDSFEIEQDDYFSCLREGEIIGIYHSCPDAAFSENDIHHANEWPLPLYLYSTKTSEFKSYIPKNYRPEYLGRPFIWGIYDCYTIVKDFYRLEYNLYLGDYDCNSSYENGQKQDIILNFSKEGFLQSSEISPKRGDILLFICGREYHLGIYLEGNRFLHQPLNAQSRIESIDGYWAKNLKFILVHKSRL